MKGYALRQVVQLAVVIVGISMLSFAILHVIGDPVTLLLPQNAGKEEYARYYKLLAYHKGIMLPVEQTPYALKQWTIGRRQRQRRLLSQRLEVGQRGGVGQTIAAHRDRDVVAAVLAFRADAAK